MAVQFLLGVPALLRETFPVQARFLLGPAGSGKTFRCLAEVRAALANEPEGDPLIFLAPKQATFQLERQLLAGAEISGYTRLQILSFDRLARFIFEKLKVAPPPILAEEGRVMVLRALLRQHTADLKRFDQSARRPGFAQELGTQLAELQQHQFTPAKLRSLAQNKKVRAELRDKLDDLALLLENYTSWLAEHELLDANCLLDFATAALRDEFKIKYSKLKIQNLYLDGFAEMTPQEMNLLAAVVPFCESATIAFCLDEPGVAENSWLSIWHGVGKTFQQCRQRLENLPGCKVAVEVILREAGKNRFAENSALAALEKGWALTVNASERRPPARHEEVGVQASACTPPDRLKPELQLARPETGAPTDGIRVIVCPNPEAEVAFAARAILKFVRDPGGKNRFRDCAVLVRRLDPYHKPLARVFRRHGIPFFLDRRESVAHHPLAELTRSAVRSVAFDWPHDDCFAALKAGFCLAGEGEMDRLENAALEFGWRGKTWRQPLPDNALEKIRARVFPPFENFAGQLACFNDSPSGAQLADALRELWCDLKVERTLEHWTRADEKSAVGHRPSAIHATVLEQMNVWLNNLALAFPRENLPLRDWLPILEAGLANLTVGVIPPVLDEVLIGAIDRARNPDLKLALVLGLNESVFPAAPSSPPILTDGDRDALYLSNLSPGPDLRTRLSRERFFGYIACTRASERLLLTYSRNDADGKVLNPSPLLAHLQRIFPALQIEDFSGDPDWREAEHANELVPVIVTRNRFGWSAPVPGRSGVVRPGRFENPEVFQNLDVAASVNGRAPEQTSDEHFHQLLDLPALKSLVESLAAMREPDTAENLSPTMVEKLFGTTLQTSVSRLEEFAQCPFKFFVRSGLRAGERKIFELDARERGNFQHEVLKTFHEQLTAVGKRWRDLTPPEARERIGQVAAGQMEHFRDGLLRDSAEARFAARAMAGALQNFVATIVTWMRGQYEFDPAAAELDFGGENSRATAWEIDLADGRKLALQGRIDRVDLCRDGDRALCVVTDYKSGGKELDPVLVANGVHLQLLAYLGALRHWKNPRAIFRVEQLFPTGAFYVNLRGHFEGGQTRDEAWRTPKNRPIATPDVSTRARWTNWTASARPISSITGATKTARCAKARPRHCHARNLSNCSTASNRNYARWAKRFLPARRRWSRIARARKFRASIATIRPRAGLTNGRTSSTFCRRRKMNPPRPRDQN